MNTSTSDQRVTLHLFCVCFIFSHSPTCFHFFPFSSDFYSLFSQMHFPFFDPGVTFGKRFGKIVMVHPSLFFLSVHGGSVELLKYQKGQQFRMALSRVLIKGGERI